MRHAQNDMDQFNISNYVLDGRQISGQVAYQLKTDKFIDSWFHYDEADDIDSLLRELPNLKSHFVYNGPDLHFVHSGERLEIEYLNVETHGKIISHTMAYRPSGN